MNRYICIYEFSRKIDYKIVSMRKMRKKTYRKLILEIIVEVIGVLKFSIKNTASKNGIK